MGKEIIIYKALDDLYCNPDNPEYENIYNNEGVVIAYKLLNIIHVCKQGQFITATKHPDWDYALMVFGKYPVRRFLLEPIGKIVLIRERLPFKPPSATAPHFHPEAAQ